MSKKVVMRVTEQEKELIQLLRSELYRSDVVTCLTMEMYNTSKQEDKFEKTYFNATVKPYLERLGSVANLLVKE